MEIAKRGGDCLKAICLNLSELNYFLRPVAGKLIDIYIKHQRDTEHQLTRLFAIASNKKLIYWSGGYLVIPRESPGTALAVCPSNSEKGEN